MKVKSAYEPRTHQAGAYLGFDSMKQLGVVLLSPGLDANPWEGDNHYWAQKVQELDATIKEAIYLNPDK